MPHAITWQDDEMPYVRNGKYTLTLTQDDTANGFLAGDQVFLQIYTVQVGMLRDQRIIKARFGGEGDPYKGFANVLENGTIRLWTAQRHMRDTVTFKLASDLVSRMYAYRGEGNVENVWANSIPWSVHASSSCTRCNRQLQYSGYVWCSDHVHAIADFRNGIARDEVLQRAESRRARRIVSSSYPPAAIDVNLDGTIQPHTLSQVSDVDRFRYRTEDAGPVRRPTPTTNLLLSENGTGFVR